MQKWSDLSLQQKRRLRLPRSKLTKAEKVLRKRLFWEDMWVDAGGHEHKHSVPKTEKEKEGDKSAEM